MQDFSGSISYYIEQFQLSYIRCTWSVFIKTLLMGSFSFLLSSRQLNRICDHRNLSLREFLKSLKLMILCTHHSYIWSQFQMFYEICFKKCPAFGSFRVVRYMEWDAAWSPWRKLSVGGYERSLHFGSWCSTQNPAHHVFRVCSLLKRGMSGDASGHSRNMSLGFFESVLILSLTRRVPQS